MRKALLFALSFFIISFNAQAADGFGYVEGTEYKKTESNINTGHKKSVIEIFGYHCPHCYKLEPSLLKWKKTKAKDIHFEQVPAVFNHPNWIFMARVFYTAKTLGVLDKSHLGYFHALHRDKKELYSVDSIAKFFTKYGVSEKKFKDTFESFMVDQQIRKAQKLTAQAGISGVPAIVINGKYQTDVGMAGSKTKLWKLVDHLVDK